MPINTYTQSFFRLADGSELAAYFDIPRVGDGCHPLAVILGGGYGDATAASSAFRNNAGELLDRGWAVTAPVSPKGESFGGDNISFVRQLIDLLKGRGDIRDSSVLLLGISRGAVAALEMVVREQELYRALLQPRQWYPGHCLLEAWKSCRCICAWEEMTHRDGGSSFRKL